MVAYLQSLTFWIRDMAISYSKGHHAEFTAKYTRDVVQYDLILIVNIICIEIRLVYNFININESYEVTVTCSV